MDKKFDSAQFINVLGQTFKSPGFPTCPYCGGTQFTTTNDFASITITNEFNGLKLGNTIPAGMVICTKCGHIEFFALGALGLLPKKDEKENGGKENEHK